MRPSLPPDMGDNAAAQATLEARLRREQVKRVSQMEDLSNWSGNATDGQVAKYTQATGTWGPGTVGGIQGDRLVLTPTSDFASFTSGSSLNVTVDQTSESTGTSLTNSVSNIGVHINNAGVYLATFTAVISANASGTRYIAIVPTGGTVMGEQGMRSPAAATGAVTVSVTAWFDMTTFGADLHPVLFQDSGSTLTVVARGTQFSVLRFA